MRKEEIKNYLKVTIEQTQFRRLGKLKRGKVRDIYEKQHRLYFITTDRISAFDRVIGKIPFKGCILTAISNFWFKATSHIIKNHLINMPHPNVMEVKKLNPIKIEMVVRGYITGVTSTSLWNLYQKGQRIVSGNRLPEGLRKNQKLPEPIITPSTKAEVGGDRTVAPSELIEMGVVDKKKYEKISQISLELFNFGSKLYREKGLILVDTKYEFGTDEHGEIYLIDEIHTPDSSRIWDALSYPEAMSEGAEPFCYDKEYVRMWLKNKGFNGTRKIPTLSDELIIEAASRYIEVYEKITGSTFTPPYNNAMLSLEKWAENVS